MEAWPCHHHRQGRWSMATSLENTRRCSFPSMIEILGFCILKGFLRAKELGLLCCGGLPRHHHKQACRSMATLSKDIWRRSFPLVIENIGFLHVEGILRSSHRSSSVAFCILLGILSWIFNAMEGWTAGVI